MDIRQRVLQWSGRLCLSLVMGLLVLGDSWAQTTVEPNLFPGDGATEVPINISLRWEPAARATSYDVYFGQTERPPFQCRVAGPSFVLETLTAGKSYFWRVDAVTEAGVQTGQEHRFKTASKADRDALYAWPIRIAHSVRSLYPDVTRLGNWNYTDGMIIDALYSIASRTGREDDFHYIRQYLDRFVTVEGSLDPKAYPFTLYSLDRIRPAPTLLWMYERTGDKKYFQAARYVATQLEKQPQTSDGGYWHRSTYPNQMWLDGIYMADVFAVQFGVRTNQPKYFDEAVKQITLVYKHTHDPRTGLCYHGWDETKSRPWANPETGASPEFWGRALGWYVMALADVLDWLPADHPGRKDVLPIVQSLCRSLLKYQDRNTGLWYQILDKPDAPKNYVETSCSLMFAYAMARGAQRGWLGPEYLDHALRTTRGVLNHRVDLLPDNCMDIRGTVRVGSLGGNGGFYDYYVTVPVVTNDQKSLGAFMYLSLILSDTANDTGPASREFPRRSP